MKMLTAVHWRAGLHNVANRHSILLKDTELERDALILALVCVGADSSVGEVASGYLAEEMEKWYQQNHLLVLLRKKSLWWLKRSLTVTLKNIHNDLVQQGKRKEVFLGVSFLLCAVWRKKYVIVQVGEVESLKFSWFHERNLTGNRRQSQPQDLLGTVHFQSLKFRYGRMRRGQAILICSGNMINQLGKGRIFEALKPSEFRKENQITKRLSRIGDYVWEKGSGDNCSAIYIKSQ